MTRSINFFWAVLVVGLFLLPGCGKQAKNHDEHEGHDHHDSEEMEKPEGRPQVVFKEGRGLTVPAEIRAILGLTLAPVEERNVPRTVRVTAQVFDAGPPALAGANVDAAAANWLVSAEISGARLVRVDRSTTAASGLADLVLALDIVSKDTPYCTGDFVPLTLTEKTDTAVIAVPRSALLRSASGTFVYVVNGDAFFRTPVETGAESADYLEIVEGLYLGDEVVVQPVEQLWLTELRFTKGGGHCH